MRAPDLLPQVPRKSRSSIIIGVVASVAVALGGALIPATAAHAVDPATVVSLTFDDGTSDQLAAAPILAAHGMKATFYVNSGSIGQAGYLTNAQLQSLEAAGNEIGGHTVNHPSLDTLPITEAKRQICLDRSNLLGLGYSVRSFAYPFAVVNTSLEQLTADCNYSSGRSLGDLRSTDCPQCDFAESLSPANVYNTRALPEVESTWTLADFKAAVTGAETSGGGWVQFTFHNFCGSSCGELSVNQTLFSEFLDWLSLRASTNNTTVKTVGDVIGGPVKAAVTVAPATSTTAINNPSLETLSAPNAPQCWQQAGYGTNTSTFTTVAPGRTGSIAGRLTMTAYTDGDSKIMPTQDLGTCSPLAVPGASYALSGWYTSTGDTQFEIYLRTAAGAWEYWTASPILHAASTYTRSTWTTPAVPAGYNGISFGFTISSVGTLTVDDYAIADANTVPVTTAAISPATPNGATSWYVTSPTVTLTTPESALVVITEYAIDGGAFTAYTAPIVVTNGVHTITYRSKTELKTEATKTLALSVDSVVPVLTATLNATKRSITATATDATSGVKSIELRRGDGAWSPYTGEFATGDAAVTVSLRATDKAGNVSALKQIVVPALVPVTPPASNVASTTTVTLGSSPTAYGRAVSIVISAASAGKGVDGAGSVLVDGVALAAVRFVNGSTTLNLPANLSVGTHVVTAQFDGAPGINASGSAPAALKVVKSTPRVSLKLSSTKPIVKKTKIRATVHVDIPRSTVVATGSVKVTITKGSSVVTRTAKLTRKGAAVITLPELKKKGKYSVRVTFSGSPNLLAARGHAKTVTAKVR